MDRHKYVLLVGLVICISIGQAVSAEPERGEMRGIFIKRAEKQVGEREYLAIVVRPLESDDHVWVIVPRENEDFMHAARNLKEGQRIGLAYVVQRDQKWLRRLAIDRPEQKREDQRQRRRPEVDSRREVSRDREERSVNSQGAELRRALGESLERLVGNYKRLIVQMEQMEVELRELRAENERLKRLLQERQQSRERTEVERSRDRDVTSERTDNGRALDERKAAYRRRGGVSMPNGMTGFRGVLIGKLTRKFDRGFLLKVEKLGEIWEHNKADNPKAAISKELAVIIRADEGRGEQFLRTLRNLEIGQKVKVEAFHYGGNRLTVVEQLEKYR